MVEATQDQVAEALARVLPKGSEGAGAEFFWLSHGRFLARQGAFSSEQAATLEGMMGFPNRLVHGYVTVDHRKICKLAKESCRDF